MLPPWRYVPPQLCAPRGAVCPLRGWVPPEMVCNGLGSRIFLLWEPAGAHPLLWSGAVGLVSVLKVSQGFCLPHIPYIGDDCSFHSLLRSLKNPKLIDFPKFSAYSPECVRRTPSPPWEQGRTCRCLARFIRTRYLWPRCPC